MSTGPKNLSGASGTAPVWWAPFVDKSMWLKTFTGPCAGSSMLLGVGTGAMMALQKYRLKSKLPVVS